MEETISVKVLPRAKRNEIIRSESGLKAYLTTPPEDGKANKALIKMLAAHLDLKKTQLTIVKGLRSRNKVIMIKR